MARTKLELPENFEFSTEIAVRVNDINYGGHLGNDSVLSMVHEARLRFLNSRGFSEKNAGGAGMIQTDAVIVFKSEAFHGEIMNIEVTIGEFSSIGCDFFFRITDTATGREVARAKTGAAFFDYDKRKVVKMTDAFKSSFIGSGTVD